MNLLILNIFFDGRPEQSILYILEEHQKINEGTRIVMENPVISTDSSIQEYFAFIKAIENTPENATVNFLSDSQMIVAHMNSWRWFPPNTDIGALYKKALELLQQRQINYQVLWCDRMHNYAG